MTRIAWIGLGTMGRGMALNMLRGSCDMAVCDLRPERLDEFRRQGIAVSANPSCAVGADFVFLSLPDTKAVEEVLCGENGLAGRRSGGIVVDLSTISYQATLRIGEMLARRGISFLDAPVSGMKARAEDGTLTVMCGGEQGVFEAVEPYLRRIGSKVLYMGRQGSGQLAKLINQLLFDINVAALAEILPMSVRMGLDSCKIGEIVNSGTGRSYASEFFIPRTLDGVFDEGYPLESAYKDLVSAAELSAQQKIPLPVLHAATVTYQTALLRGLGAQSKGAMIRVYEELLGVSFRRSPTD